MCQDDRSIGEGLGDYRYCLMELCDGIIIWMLKGL